MELLHKKAFNLPTNPREAPAQTCRRCGHAGLSAATVSMAFWRSAGLVVIRDIPVLKCHGCGDELLTDTTVLALDKMRGPGLTQDLKLEAMIVPVYRYSGAAGT
ncbi:MAG: YgiT-type zinc finger protein [Paracoccaceae bacterium]